MVLSTTSLDSLTRFLRIRGWIPPGAFLVDRVRLGGGRTATTVRVTTNAGATRVLRQPDAITHADGRHVMSPADRLAVEGEFYSLIQPWSAITERMPLCLGVDRSDHIIALQDLGTARALTDLYVGRLLSSDEVDDLTAYLVALHGISVHADRLGALRGDGVRLARHADRAERFFGSTHVLDLAGLATRAEADRRFAAILPEAGVRAFLLQSLDLHASPPRWRLNLDTLDAEMAHITGWPDIAGRFEGPALFLAGAESAYVRPEHRPAISARFPAARIARIPGAGHWLHADRPAATAAAVRAFLDAP